MNYSKLIRLYRERHFLSQKEFAALIKVSYISVSRWEQGHFSPTLKVKKRLHDLFVKSNIQEE